MIEEKETPEKRAKEFELFLANRNPADLDSGECEKIAQSRERQPMKAPEIETENIFDSEPADDPFEDNPMKMLRGMMGDLKDMALNPRPIGFMPPLEHKVKIFCFDGATNHQVIEAEIEALLNAGYRCHAPAVCGDFLIMDFSRIKESEEDGK